MNYHKNERFSYIRYILNYFFPRIDKMIKNECIQTHIKSYGFLK